MTRAVLTVRVLCQLRATIDGRTVNQLAGSLRVSERTIWRVLADLRNERLLGRHPHTGRYYAKALGSRGDRRKQVRST